MYAENHITHDSLVNGVDGMSKDFTTTLERLVWIDFGTPSIGTKTWLKYLTAYVITELSLSVM